MKLNLRTQKKNQNSRVRFDVEKLKNREIRKNDNDELENKLVSVNIDEVSINEEYTHISNIITLIAQYILGIKDLKNDH